MPSRIREKVDSGGIVTGALIHSASQVHVEIACRSGLDFLMLDTEHGVFDLETAGGMARTARALGVSALVRVLSNDRFRIMKALDLGAVGVVVPHVSTVFEAESAIAATRFEPVGQRGACPVVTACDFGIADWMGVPHDAFVVLLIEDEEGVENAKDIAAVEGVDCLFVGQFDLSVSMGLRGQVENPRVIEASERIISAATEAGLPAMISTGSAGGGVDGWIEKGARLLLHGADTAVYAKSCQQFVQACSQAEVSDEISTGGAIANAGQRRVGS